MLITFAGLPGSGKTTIAQLLARELGAVYLRADTIEQAMREWGLDSDGIGGMGYTVGYRLAAENLKLGLTVVTDSVNPWTLTRDAWRQAAHDAGASFLDVEVVCSDSVEHRRRVESRAPDIEDFNLPSWEEVINRDYHAWETPRLIVDSAQLDPAQAVELIKAEIGRIA